MIVFWSSIKNSINHASAHHIKLRALATEMFKVYNKTGQFNSRNEDYFVIFHIEFFRVYIWFRIFVEILI